MARLPAPPRREAATVLAGSGLRPRSRARPTDAAERVDRCLERQEILGGNGELQPRPLAQRSEAALVVVDAALTQQCVVDLLFPSERLQQVAACALDGPRDAARLPDHAVHRRGRQLTLSDARVVDDRQSLVRLSRSDVSLGDQELQLLYGEIRDEPQ